MLRRCFLFGWIRGGLRLESLRNRLAHFLEEVSNRLRTDAPSAEKQKRCHWQRDPARTNKMVSWVLGVQCEHEIFRRDRGRREGKFSLHENFWRLYQNG